MLSPQHSPRPVTGKLPYIRAGLLAALLIMSGCSSNMLPSSEQTIKSQWNSYEDVKMAFNRIIPGQTTRDELKDLGFDLYTNPNTRLLNYLDVRQLFMPNSSIQTADLHPDIQLCLQAKTACQGYEIALKSINSTRYGNVMLDMLNMKRKTRTSGWRFQGLIILNDDQVVYTLDSGQPNVLELEGKKNPLGPLQDISISPKIPLK